MGLCNARSQVSTRYGVFSLDQYANGGWVMKDSFCIEFASALALMLLELRAELQDLAEQDDAPSQAQVSTELERVL